jgi:hypothetical protein
MTECDAEGMLAVHLGRDVARLRRQVPLGGKVIDLLVEWMPCGQVLGEMETIEVKLRDWRRAASQAFINRAYVGRASIALPANPRRKVNTALLEELGVGLIEFDESGWWRVLAPADVAGTKSVEADVRTALG